MKPVQFEEALKLAADRVFANSSPGCRLKRIPTGLGLEVRTPGSNLTLIYVWAKQRSAYVPEFEDPVFAVEVYERDVADKWALENSTLRTHFSFLVRRRHVEKPTKQGEGTCRTAYAASFIEVIQETREASVLHMAEILALIRADFIEI